MKLVKEKNLIPNKIYRPQNGGERYEFLRVDGNRIYFKSLDVPLEEHYRHNNEGEVWFRHAPEDKLSYHPEDNHEFKFGRL